MRTKFIKLKTDGFTYIDKTYTQERFINEDKTVLVTRDELDFIKVYTGNNDGKAERIYLRDNESCGYPLYTIGQVIELLRTYKGDLKTISIHESHYKDKLSKLNKFQKAINQFSKK